MPGPKSPFGYDRIFFDILAYIRFERPDEMEVDTEIHPARFRSLFNQFRTSWEREAATQHKKKDTVRAREYLENYHLLLRYACTLREGGVLLTSKERNLGSIRMGEKRNIDLLGPIGPVNDLEVRELEKELQREAQAKAEATVKSIFGPTPKSEQVTTDNPPQSPPSEFPNKYNLPVGTPPDEK